MEGVFIIVTFLDHIIDPFKLQGKNYSHSSLHAHYNILLANECLKISESM